MKFGINLISTKSEGLVCSDFLFLSSFQIAAVLLAFAVTVKRLGDSHEIWILSNHYRTLTFFRTLVRRK